MSTHWILVADASRARVLAADGHFDHLAVVQEFDHDTGRLRTSELVSDDRGRTWSGPGGIHGAMDGHEDAARRDHEVFADELATFIDRALDVDAYDHLVLAAPPRFLGMLRDHLTPRVAARVDLTIDRDYTKVALPELRPLLAQHQPG